MPLFDRAIMFTDIHHGNKSNSTLFNQDCVEFIDWVCSVAKEKNINYAIGVAKHQDMPRGKIMGAQSGMLKIIFNKESLAILGVHIVGHLATELIHHGMGLIENNRTLLDVIGNVYNFPTLHDLYKYAAYDGLGNLTGHKVKQ